MSPAGVALAAAQPKRDPETKFATHLPDTPSQRGWLAAWQEIRKKSSAAHQELCQLVAVYLSTMSNSGTVDRYLGQVKLQSLRRGHISRGGLEAALRFTVQDLCGRARTRLSPTELLLESVPRTTSDGVLVAQPASKYSLHCQKLYTMWFGERCLPGRRIEPDSQQPARLTKARLASTKPRLAPLRKKSDFSEGAFLQKHRASVDKAVARMEHGGGGVAEGPLGQVEIPEQISSVKRRMSAQASACLSVAKRRRGIPNAEAAPATAPSDDLSADLEAVQLKQTKILNEKRLAAGEALPGQPTPCVDANAGRMRPAATSSKKTMEPPILPMNPRLHRSPSMSRAKAPPNFVRTSEPYLPDVVLVRDAVASWESPCGLLARLAGARLVNQTWLDAPAKADRLPDGAQEFCFKSVLKSMHFDLFLTAGFFKSHAEHAEVLQKWSTLSLTMKSRGRKVKRLTVRDLRVDPLPEKPLPGVMYIVKEVGETWGGKEPTLTLSELLLKMTVLLGQPC